MTYETVNEATLHDLSVPDRYWDELKYFEHFTVRTVDEATALLSEYGTRARIIAGGVDVLSLMRNKVINPKVLVNIKTIAGLKYIKADAAGVKIGALTTINDISRSAFIARTYPMLAEAAGLISSPQVRNMATLAGDLCQEVRCWYYRMPPVTGVSYFCRRKGGDECYARGGDNRYHAILGSGECAAVSPSDMATALIALGATLKIVSPAGEKVLPLEQLYSIMGITLKTDEIITEVQVPATAPGTKQRFVKFRERQAIDFALSSVALAIAIEGGVVNQARIVLGGVAPVPYRAVAAEAVLLGKSITGKLAEIAAETALREARPLSMNAYKTPLTRALVKRAIAE